MTAIDDVFFLDRLMKENGYQDAKPLGDGRYACIMPLAFTHAIITGRMGDHNCYEDRWCYHSYQSAKAALDAWSGAGEPDGWHRHPATGRRRTNGEQETEHVWY